MAKIDIDNKKMWESLLSLSALPPELHTLIEVALSDQNLEWNGKEIVSIEPQQQPCDTCTHGSGGCACTCSKHKEWSENKSQKEPLKPIFKVGDIIIHKEFNIVFEISGIDFDNFYLVKNRNGLTIPFEFQDHYELMSDNAKNYFFKIIRKQIAEEIDEEKMVMDYQQEYRCRGEERRAYRQGIIDTIKKLKGE